jgi:hypothetical protein
MREPIGANVKDQIREGQKYFGTRIRRIDKISRKKMALPECRISPLASLVAALYFILF